MLKRSLSYAKIIKSQRFENITQNNFECAHICKKSVFSIIMLQLRFTAQYRATQRAYYQKEREWGLNLRLTFVSLFVKQLNLTQINKFSCFSKIIP